MKRRFAREGRATRLTARLGRRELVSERVRSFPVEEQAGLRDLLAR
jgi:hypothetical protein